MKVQLLLPCLFEAHMPDGSSIDTTAINPWLPEALVEPGGQWCYEQVLMQVLGFDADQPGSLPIADCLYLDTPGKHSVCAQPVHLDASHDDARLLPGQCLSLTTAESSELVATLNALWNPDGIYVTAHSAVDWQITGQNPSALDSLPTAMLAYKSVADALPRSTEAAAWRQLLTEAQMMLHEHPVNISRQQRGLRSVNSIWCFGGGVFAQPPRTVPTHLLASDPFAQGLATRLNIACRNIDEFSNDNLNVAVAANKTGEGSDLLIADTRLQQAWLANDIEQFSRDRHDVIERLLNPISQAGSKTKQMSYQIDDCNGNRFKSMRATGLVATLQRVFSSWR